MIMELLQETTRTTGEEEVEIHETQICLLCGEHEQRVYNAKEVIQVSKLGEVKITTLVSENGDRPAFITFESTTHRRVCPVCTPRLKRLTKGQLVQLVMKLAGLVGFEAQRRGVADGTDVMEIRRK